MDMLHRNEGAWGARITRSELMTLGVMVAIAWAYVVLRAFRVPFVQDEGNSFWLFVRTGEFLPFLSHPEAGNHFLSSLSGVLGYQMFGNSAAGIRWGSVAAYPFYAWACWYLVRPLGPPVRWCCLLALLLCPFLLDYFSMFRGYGPAMAGWAWALYALLSFAREGAPRYFVLLMIASGLALFSDLSLLPSCAVLLGLSVPVILPRVRTYRLSERLMVTLALLLLVAMLAFAACIALDLQHRGLLYLGGGGGFMRVTAVSLAGAVFGGAFSLDQVWALALPMICAVGIALWQCFRRRQWQQPLAILAAVLVLEVTARQVMFRVLGTNFPQDRAALQLVPVYILLFAYAIHALVELHRAWAWAAVPLLALPLRTALTLNTDHAMSNFEQATPLRFIDDVDSLWTTVGRPPMLSGFGQLATPWAFHQLEAGEVIIPMRPDPLPDDPDDARVLAEWQLKQLGVGYHVVDSCAASGVFLLFRDMPCTLVPWRDSTMARSGGRAETIALPVFAEGDTSDRCLVFTATVSVTDPDFGVQLVTEVYDSTGTTVRYDAVDLAYWPRSSSGAQVELTRYLPAVPKGGRKAYLRNWHHADCQLKDVHIRLMGIRW
jgi:hypothetical protein